MVALYGKLIIAKRRILNDVPYQYKEQVKAWLLDHGYDINGDPIEGGERDA